MSVSYTLRMPDDLRRLIAQAAKSGGVSDAQLVVDACWKYLDKTGSGVESQTYQNAGVGNGLGQPANNRESSALTSPTKPDMQALRDICAGNIGPKTEDAYIDDLIREDVESHQLLTKLCIVCEEPMREVKGKWACSDPSCAMYGREVKK
jgi:hypothetical protein